MNEWRYSTEISFTLHILEFQEAPDSDEEDAEMEGVQFDEDDEDIGMLFMHSCSH